MMERKKREFKVEPIHADKIPYNPLVDRHLEYYFSSKKNRDILIKTKVVNRKNQILDRDLKKMIENGHLSISNKFRLKQSKPKHMHAKRYESIDPKPNPMNKTVGKKQFEEFLEKQRNQLRNKTMIARTTPPQNEIAPVSNEIKLISEDREQHERSND